MHNIHSCDRLLKGGYLSIPQHNVDTHVTEAGRGSYEDSLLEDEEDEEDEGVQVEMEGVKGVQADVEGATVIQVEGEEASGASHVKQNLVTHLAQQTSLAAAES